MNRAGLRLLLFLLLSAAAGLSGCALLHPRRITNPNLPPGYKAEQRAARQAQKNSAKAAASESKARQKNKDADAESTGGTAAGAAPTPSDAASGTGQPSRALPDKPTVKYDKNGLMKKPKLKRRHYYKPDPKPFRPLQSIRTFFKNLRKKRHAQSSDKAKAAPKTPAAPAPAPVNSGLTP